MTDVLRLPDGIVACRGLSAGCLVIGSHTPPVSEVIDGRNGILVPFFDIEQLSERVIEAWAHPRRFAEFRARAHRTAVEQFDMERKCLPQLLALLRGEAPRLPGGGKGPRANAKYGGLEVSEAKRRKPEAQEEATGRIDARQRGVGGNG